MKLIKKNNIMYYLYTKLVGAGFAYSLFIIFITMNASMNLFDLSEELASPWPWVAFYGYGIIASLIIDGVGKAWPTVKSREIYLYLFAGFLAFAFLITQWVFFVFAGFIGMIAALFFYVGAKFVSRSRWMSITFGVLVPIVLVVVLLTDFTKKEDWEVIETEFTFEANYTYFDGEHKIPFTLDKGDALAYKLTFFAEYGGWGNHFEDEKGRYQSMDEDGDWLIFTAETAGDYFIVVHGHKASGRFVVDWEITSD